MRETKENSAITNKNVEENVNLTKEDLEKYKKLDNKFKHQLVKVVNTMGIVKNGNIEIDDLAGIDFVNDNVEFGIPEETGYDYEDLQYYSVPEHCLLNNNIEDISNKETEERKLLKNLLAKYPDELKTNIKRI